VLGSAETVRQTADALTPIGVVAALGWAIVGVSALLAGAVLRSRPRSADETWGCGYASPSPRMQYTARSFSEFLAERLLPRFLAPCVRMPALRGSFPGPAALASEERDPVTRGAYEPLFHALATRFARLRALQQGNAHLYLTYILSAVLAALAWISLRVRWLL
jgi:hypothetical protein